MMFVDTPCVVVYIIDHPDPVHVFDKGKLCQAKIMIFCIFKMHKNRWLFSFLELRSPQTQISHRHLAEFGWDLVLIHASGEILDVAASAVEEMRWL